ncbi:MAG TPA: DUF3300 domain-containing protein [Candidatus Binatia bacterium]|jgi:hypothetical protein
MNKDTIKKPLAVLLALSLLSAPAAGVSPFAAAPAAAQGYGQPQDRYSRQQLENLLAPVALYPDPLLAQVLVAATFDEDIEEASRFVRRYRDPNAVDDQPWDVSVKAVAHYPSVIHMMADKIDWTVALGQAYVEQPQDVMDAVQFLRRQAHRAGNLVTTEYHQVIVEREYIEIVPYRPNLIYIPVYEPEIIFFRPAAVITFGVAFPIGVWLIHDFDWHAHRVYYHGWRGDRVWIVRSRPHVRITNVYVNNRYTNVTINRNVVRRNVNVTNLSRFNTVNREVKFDNVERRNRERGSAGDVRASRREGAEKGLQKDRDRGGANIAPRTKREDSTDVKQKEPSPGAPGKRSIPTPGGKAPEGSFDRAKQGRGAEDAPRRLRQGQEGPGQPNDKGAQGAREQGRAKQPQGKQKKGEEKKHQGPDN